jgi:hypothetical protein
MSAAIEATGIFLIDYQEQCRRLKIRPLNIHKVVPHTLQLPSSSPQTASSSSSSAQNNNVSSSSAAVLPPVPSSAKDKSSIVNGRVQSPLASFMMQNRRVPVEESGPVVTAGGASAVSAAAAATTAASMQSQKSRAPRSLLTPSLTLVVDPELLSDADIKNDEDVSRIEIRGWKVLPSTIEAICGLVPYYSNITTLK